MLYIVLFCIIHIKFIRSSGTRKMFRYISNLFIGPNSMADYLMRCNQNRKLLLGK